MRILAVDPSLRGTGFAILENITSCVRCIEYAVIKNHPTLTQEACLVAIYDDLLSAIDRHQPIALAIEKVIYVQSYSTAIILGAARGIAVLVAAQRGLTIHEYTPKRVKQAVVGRGSATKDQVAFMIRNLLNLSKNPPIDASDAIAIGLTHFRMIASPFLNAVTSRPT